MSGTLTWLFGVDDRLTALQACARTVVVFTYGFVLLRIFGRRLFGKWSAVDITVSIIIGSNLSRTITGNAPLGVTLAASTVLMALHWVISRIAARSRYASTILEGRPVDLVTGGKVDETARQRWGISHADLDEAIRGSGCEQLDAVVRLTLEPSGSITIQKAAR